MKVFRCILLLVIVAFLALPVEGSVQAQTSDSVYVPETGHWIKEDFLLTYNGVADPLLYFGYPITDEFTDPESGRQVQFFQRAVFELVNDTEGKRVVMLPLGSLLHEDGAEKADIPNEGPTCRAFDNGISVCYAFLQFYDAYDGDTWFGNPVSEVEVEDGHFVQYFENVRMEWWPDKPSGQKVNLSDLGRIYFEKMIGDPELLTASTPLTVNRSEDKPSVNVFALHSLIGAGEQQTVFVIVQDKFLKPMPGAQVGVTIYYPDEDKEFYRLGETNELGVSRFTFPVGNYESKSTIFVEAEATLRGETGKGKTWFRIWW